MSDRGDEQPGANGRVEREMRCDGARIEVVGAWEKLWGADLMVVFGRRFSA